MSSVWTLSTASNPEQGIAEIRFTPSPTDPSKGETSYTATAPTGEMWLVVVEEFLTGPELDVFVGAELREGPHDRDLAQLEAALREVPRNYPNLRILGLDDGAVVGPPPGADPAVEAVKALIRERFVADWSARPAEEKEACEATLKAFLDPVSRAAGEHELTDALAKGLETIKRAKAPFRSLAENALRELASDVANNAGLSPVLGELVHRHRTWLVKAPDIVH